MKKKLLLLFTCSFMIGVVGIIISMNFKTIRVSSLMPYFSTEDLMVQSELIVRGTISKVLDSRWTNPDLERGKDIRNILQTDYLLDISEVYKGTPYDQKSIVIRSTGGKKGTVRMIAGDDYAQFDKGEEVILFLHVDDSDVAFTDEKYYTIFGERQAKFVVDKSSDLSGKTFKSEVIGDRNRINIDTFKNDISAAIQAAELNPNKPMTREEIQESNQKLFKK